MNNNSLYTQSMSRIGAVAFAFVYAMFVSKVGDIIFESEKIKNMCKNISNDSKCYDNKTNLEKEFDVKKFKYIGYIATIGILFGSFFVNKSINNIPLADLSVSVGLGSLFLMIVFCAYNWNSMSDATKLSVLGISLGGMLTGMIKFN